jgi:hypothetical protein
MTFETKPDPSNKIATKDWMPATRRHGEVVEPLQPPQESEPADDELIFPVISSPSVWPRIFPGL